MHKITVVTLGPGDKDMLTLGACEALKKADRVILKTRRHGAADWLTQQGIPFGSLDTQFENAADFDDLAAKCAQHIVDAAKDGTVAYGVFDCAHDESVMHLQLASGVETILLPGVPQHTPLLAAANFGGAYTVSDAAGLLVTDAQRVLCVTEMDSALLAGECKLKLLPWYGANSRVLYFPSLRGERRPVQITLEQLDRQKYYGHRAACIVFPGKLTEKTRWDAQDLLSLMRVLRGENGCPWDRKQTHQSLRPFLIEEAYETALAIDEGDYAHVADELGDVLLQVALHAVIGEEYGTMHWTDITSDICRKMIFRHRHVFGEDECLTAEAVVDNWARIKQEERGQETVGQAMADVEKGLPPLIRAEKIQKKAHSVGFDWDTPLSALEKVFEEAQEVREDLQKGDDPTEELGDLFFSCVNVARLCGVNSEESLSKAVKKFLTRFTSMESRVDYEGKSLNVLTIDEMQVYWNRSKYEV
ncbi:MAG: nucleoside triphosphate pyrophosphohydrolase [Eubacteriales bacterium]|jgi:tetrapyrrole methylase family protein/MazG family protein|nr:nucleoside triphosphate pyrophosphohydrolase [Eubacteriales bacterium]MDD4105790.1 nucleoside triphosphate pyrophosphohydrolase [Eubacteriales bacterium]MDD4711037.1 nucleoside triphosphate pyrophosphohydrolase [Eubacteriales bacterium]NLO16133.1 nucleoside triphosphate pyrophosphohydrolase [Clostridiales bacterium]